MNKLSSQQNIIQYDKEKGLYIHEEFLQRATQEIISTLSEYHEKYPLKNGLIKEELRSRTIGSGNQKLFNYIISQQIKSGIIVQENELLRMKGHKVTLARDQEEMQKEIEDAYLKKGLTPPYFKEVSEKFPDGGKDILGVMIKDGILIKVKEDLYFHQRPINALKEKLIAFLQKNGEINTPQFKEMTGASRKYSIPLLEYFDHEQVTVRVGDNRILRKKI